MRIKILRKPSREEADGIDLHRFVPGQLYDVGNRIGARLLAEGWVEPLADDSPVRLVPFHEDTTVSSEVPPNLSREVFPRSTKNPVAVAADFEAATATAVMKLQICNG